MTPTITVIIFVVALVFTVGFLILAIMTAPAILQLKMLLKDLEKTSEEARTLIQKLQSLSEKVEADVDKVDSIIESSKETMTVVSNSVKLINRNVVAKSAGLMAFIPALRLGWNLVRKLKGGSKNV